MTDSALQRDDAWTSLVDPDQLIGDRFQTRALLKKGPGVVTMLGFDMTADMAVVIKLVESRSVGAAVQMRLEHAARLMRDINGAGCSGLTHCGRQDGLLYLVRPYCEGITLQQRLATSPLDVHETVALGQSLMEALRTAHGRGALHLDIKPDNIVVPDESPVKRAALIDFGFSRSLQLEFVIDDEPVEAARYMSPEQAGMLGHDVGETADLYAAGVVLFECLAGRPPFEAATVGDVLRQHMTETPPKLRSLGLPVPRSLDEVIQRLLRKDPRDRYQSAEAVGADLAVIAAGLQRGESEPPLVVGLHDRRHTLTEPAFVGRDPELATLQDQLDRSRQGRNSVVFLEADSGAGKSRLLLEFMNRCSQEGTWVLRGQGQDQVAQRPFEMLAGIAAGLISDAQVDPTLADKVRLALGDQLNAVCTAFPELADVFLHSTSHDIGPETFAETRSLYALSDLLDALGAAGRPVAVLLDDCQWADQLTIRVLRHWQRRTAAERGFQQGGILLVAAFRSEEVAAHDDLRSLRPSAHLRLPELPAASVRQLVESMAGPLPDDAVELIERLAAGSPFMASAALRGLVESGALVATSEGWKIDETAMFNVQSSRHAAAFLSRRIALLPEASVKLLSVGAVLGKEFDLSTAAMLAGQSSGEAIAALDEARRRHIVWARNQDNHCVFMHDMLRETLLNEIPDDERRELHVQAALDLETRDPQPLFDLAYHYDAAGQYKRALPYALAAADAARIRCSLELAEQQYRIAQRGARSSDQAKRGQIAEGLGDTLMLAGKYPEAAEQFVTARALATGVDSQARIEGKIGELAFKRGNNKVAAEALERSLRLLGRRIPKHAATFCLFLIWEAWVQALHTLLPSLFLARRKLPARDAELLGIRLYTTLAYAYFFDRGKIPCLWAHLRAINLAERYPPTPELGHAWATHAPAMALLPWLARGETFAKKSLEVRLALGDQWGQGQSLNYWGVVLSVGSKFDECIEKCSEAVRLLQRTGDFWEMHIARWMIADAIYRKGELKRAASEARKLYESASEMGDDKVSGFSLDVWSRASGGQLPAQIVHREMEKERHDVQASVQVLLAEGVRLVGHEQYSKAIEVLVRAQQVCANVGMESDWVAPVWPWLATAYRLQYQTAAEISSQDRDRSLHKARRAVRQALRMARKFPSDLPHALREAAHIRLMRGAVRAAREYFDESLDVAQQQGARFEYAQTQLARGRAGRALGWQGASDDVVAARRTLVELGAEFALDELPEQAGNTLSLADRFDTVLESGREIAAALTPELIFESVRDATLKLLRGEHSVVLPVNSNQAAETLANVEHAGNICPNMVERAVAERRAVVYAEGATDDPGETLLLSHTRSAICAPILVRGRVEACFYVTHRQISNLFGEDEQHLAEFIATIAGAALENAEGFAQLQQLTETLEQRVQERTSALETSNLELQQFAYVASHDLQTPLRGIAGFAQFLKKDYQGKIDAKADDYIDRIVTGAKRMQTLIHDLLAYSRVESRSRPFEFVDLNEVFEDALEILHASIEDTNGAVTGDRLPTVPGDRAQLSQLLQNLIGNGLKYHGAEPPTVHVAVERGEGEWIVAVSDNGIGMAAKHHERIFEIFRRLHTQDEYPGTGIGLAVCRRIVHRHAGKIWVQSEVDKGSTFFFTLSERGLAVETT